MGRRLFDVIDGPGGGRLTWAGAQLAGTPPFFVVTHHAPDDVRLSREVGLQFTFVDDLGRGCAGACAAGDRDVVIMGGGDVIAQAIEGGLVDGSICIAR